MKGVIHLLMVQWDLGNVYFLIPFWWKVKKMYVGRLQFELIFGRTSGPSSHSHPRPQSPYSKSPLVVQRNGKWCAPASPLRRSGSTQGFWPISQLLKVARAWCPECPAPSPPPHPQNSWVSDTASWRGVRPGLSWGGRGGIVGMWPGGNKSKFLRNDLTGNDRAAASSHPSRTPLAEGASLRAGRSPS